MTPFIFANLRASYLRMRLFWNWREQNAESYWRMILILVNWWLRAAPGYPPWSCFVFEICALKMWIDTW